MNGLGMNIAFNALSLRNLKATLLKGVGNEAVRANRFVSRNGDDRMP